MGEDLAAAWLAEQGYSLLHRNWRHRHWEVDIIATKNTVLHFVEVKTRKGIKFGHPEEKIGKKKLSDLINAAEEFTYQNPQWKKIQFDVLAITIIAGEPIAYFLIEDVYL